MRSNDLLDIIGEAADVYIQDAKNAKKKAFPLWAKRASAIAVCLSVAVTGVLILSTLRDHTGNSTEKPANSNYPYNDHDVIDYVGMPLDSIQTEAGTVLFNEITDIEAYRKFNTSYVYENKPYYSTRMTAYDLLTGYPTAGEADIINAAVFERDGTVENCPNYDEFLLFKDKAPIAAELILEIFENDDTTHADVYYNGSIDSYGISFRPESNCVATVVIGKDIASIDSRFENVLPMFRSTLGTENSSLIGTQKVSVNYFYQNRLFRDSKTEEAYQYYAYFEQDGLQYLYQFSSNWSLIGQNISAIHNPPATLHYVQAQDACRERFVEYLLLMVNAVSEWDKG